MEKIIENNALKTHFRDQKTILRKSITKKLFQLLDLEAAEIYGGARMFPLKTDAAVSMQFS